MSFLGFKAAWTVFSHIIILLPLKTLHFAITGRYVSHLSAETKTLLAEDVTCAVVAVATLAEDFVASSAVDRVCSGCLEIPPLG